MCVCTCVCVCVCVCVKHLGSAVSSQSKESNALNSSTLEYVTCIPVQDTALHGEEEEEGVISAHLSALLRSTKGSWPNLVKGCSYGRYDTGELSLVRHLMSTILISWGTSVYILQHCAAPHCTVLHYTTIHNNTLHCNIAYDSYLVTPVIAAATSM
jgi:hypothetical protein